MNCLRCGYREGGHSPKCPELLGDGPSKIAAIAIWQYGYNHGRSGRGRQRPHPTDLREGSPAQREAEYYNLGYLRGGSALEEAENSSRW